MNETENTVPIRKVNVESAETDLDKFIKMGILEKSVEVVSGYTITIHALSQEEHESLTKKIVIPQNDKDETLFSRLEGFKVPSLVQAITKIGSQNFVTPQEKEELQAKLLKAPNLLISKLWDAYNSLCVEQVSLLTSGVKKN